jgi:hypothetical protein
MIIIITNRSRWSINLLEQSRVDPSADDMLRGMEPRSSKVIVRTTWSILYHKTERSFGYLLKMYTLPIEVFSSITSLLPNSDLLILSKSSATLNTGIRTVSQTSKFWQDRCSTLLGMELGNYGVNWKRVYLDLSQTIDFIVHAGKGNTDTVLVLLEAGVDPTAKDNYAIQYASENGHLEVVKLLLEQPGVDPSADDNHAIRWASQKGHLEVVKLLLEQPGVDPSAEDNYAIQWASENGHLEVVKLLLKQPGVDPSADNNSAIRYASAKGHLEVVKLLLEQPGVDPSAEDNYAIRWASAKGHLEVVKLLLKQPGVDPSANNNYAIRWASENGHLEVVKLLLEQPGVYLP